jgi:hypothetical protein
MRDTKDLRPRHAVVENDLEDLLRSVRQPRSFGNQHGSQEGFVEPSKPRDETINILSARHKKTDDLIENLQRALREQAISRMPESEMSIPFGRLSGAKASRLGRRRDSVQEHSTRIVQTRKKDECVQIARRVSKIEKLVPFSEKQGIDMSLVTKDIANARTALDGQRTTRAKRAVASADRHARDAISRMLPSLMRETNSSLRQLENVCGSADALRHLAKNARTAQRRKEHVEALRSLAEARKGIREAENEAVLRIIADAKDRFVMAKKAGLNLDEAVSLLNKSRDELRRGEFAEAIRCAREGRKVVETSFDQSREARLALMECIKAVKLAEALGADVQEMNGMLEEGRSLFKQNDFAKFAECSHGLLDLAQNAAYDRAAESYELAEKALTLARKAGVEISESEEKLRRSRELLENDELAKSLSMACSSLFESNSALVSAMGDRLNNIDEFAKGIEREVDSLTEVREAIDNSKERNLENLKRYVKLSEEIIGDAYESAAAYSCVAQDIVKQAYESSVQMNPFRDLEGKNTGRLDLSSRTSPNDGLLVEDKRQRLIDLYLTGKVSENQLDKLLLMIDSSVAKGNLV